MNLIDEQISVYAEAHTTEESDILKRINRETHAKVMLPQMLSGHLQGRFLAMLSKMIKPKHILEVGTYTGYSAISLAEGLQKGGQLHTIDINEELREMVEMAVSEAGMGDYITLHVGDALEIIPGLDMGFDLAFIDADKVNYSNYYDLIVDKLNPGGYIIADNVLWSGKVLEEKRDKDTAALVAFNEKIQADDRVENLLVPIRDGLMLIRKLD